MPKWLLPEHVADILPAEARRIEDLRRSVLDRFRSYGYELVIPPLLEYLDALVDGTGGDLDLRTFKLVDQLSGKSLGLRADFTPQVARIDAHLLNRDGVVRLCYAGSVLHTRPRDLNATREPLQIGAELYGHAGVEADLEIADLALQSAALAGVDDARIELSHMGVLRALLGRMGGDRNIDALVDLVRAKDVPALRQVGLDGDTLGALETLCDLYGGTEVIGAARARLPALAGVQEALAGLERLCAGLPSDRVGIDLADLHGYTYHSGIMFAVYGPGASSALVRGGRYDDVGRQFGRARPATGFSLDLRALAAGWDMQPPGAAIRAPWGTDPELRAVIARLRLAGDIVVQVLPEQGNAAGEYACDRELRYTNEGWQVFGIVE